MAAGAAQIRVNNKDPNIHLRKEDRGVGLTEHLAGHVDLHKAISPTRIGNLFLMSSGSSPPNPADSWVRKKCMTHFRTTWTVPIYSHRLFPDHGGERLACFIDPYRWGVARD